MWFVNGWEILCFEGTWILQNDGNHLPIDTALNLRQLESSKSSLWHLVYSGWCPEVTLFCEVTAACRSNPLPQGGRVCHMPKVTRNGGSLLSAPGLVLHYIGNQLPCTAWSSDLKMAAASGSSNTSVPRCQITWRHILVQLTSTIHIRWSQRPCIMVSYCVWEV
jgi:hypothetical protein